MASPLHASFLLILLHSCKTGPLLQTGPFPADPFPDPLSIVVVGDPGNPDGDLFQRVGILDDAYSTWCVKLEAAFQGELDLQGVTCRPFLQREGLAERSIDAGGEYDTLYLPTEGNAFPFVGRWPAQILFIDNLRLTTTSQLLSKEEDPPPPTSETPTEDTRADLTAFTQMQGYQLREATWEVSFSVTWWDNQQGKLAAYDEVRFRERLEGSVLVGKHLDQLAVIAVQQIRSRAPGS